MLSQTHSRWDRFYNIDAVQSVPFVTNGQVVQSVMENGVRKGRPSDGTDNAIFLGVSFGIYKGLGTSIPKLETPTTGASSGGLATALLSKVVSNPSDIKVYKGADSSGTVMTPTSNGAAPTSATSYRLESDGRTLTVTDANPNTALFVVYKYSPTVIEQRFLLEGGGDLYPGNNAPAVFGQVGVITEGIVYTDQYDISVNWAAVDDSVVIKGAANGKFTVGGTGCACKGVRVHRVPGVDSPFLGLTLGYSI